MKEENKKIVISYTNHRADTRERCIIPIQIWFGVSKWHEGEQWFLKAFDSDKQEERDFAFLSIKSVQSAELRSAGSDSEGGFAPVEMKEVQLYADGGSRGNPGPAAGGFVILNQDNEVIHSNGKYLGVATNNHAEYHAVKGGLEACLELGYKNVAVFLDSLLVVNQMKGIYKVRHKDLLPIYLAIKELVPKFDKISFTHVPREMNKLADEQVNITLDAISELGEL